MADLKATPRSSVLGAIADALTRARSIGDKAKIPFTDMGLGELFLGKMPEEVNEWSYGNAPLQVVGRGTGSRVPQIKQGRREQLVDTVFGLQGMAPLAAASTRAVKAIPSAVRHGAEEFAHASAAANPRIVKSRGGNWLRGEGTEYLDSLYKQDDAEVYDMFNSMYPDLARELDLDAGLGLAELSRKYPKQWTEARTAGNPLDAWTAGPLTKYVKRDLGAESDPLLKLADEGIFITPDIERTNLPNWVSMFAGRNRAEGGLKQPMLSPQAQQWSNLADAMVRPDEVGAMRTGLGANWRNASKALQDHAKQQMGSYWPDTIQREGEWLGKLTDEDRLYSFIGDEAPTWLGFDRLVDSLGEGMRRTDLPPHLRLTPERLQQMGIEKAVRYKNDVENFVKQQAEAELFSAGKVPAYGGTRVKNFDNGFYITDLTKPTELTDDMRNLVRENPDGTWTALSPSGKPMQRRVVPGESAPLVDVVEATPEDAILGATLGHEGLAMNHCVGGYCYDVAKGKTKVYSLRDAEGKPHVTVEVEQPGATRPIVRQVYGAANSEPKPEYKALLGKYLQEAGLTGDERAMRNAGLYPLRDKWVTQDELSSLIKPSTEGAAPDYDAIEAWQRHIIDNGDIRFAEGGLVEGNDDFAYPGMF